MPFAGRLRVCIGNNFAMMEAQIILGTLSSRFNLELMRDLPVEFDQGMTLRPKYDFRMKLVERD